MAARSDFVVLLTICLILIFQSCRSLEVEEVDNLEECPWQDLRLPDTVKPIHYELFIHPNLTTYDMTGKVNIFFRVKDNINHVVIHAKDLSIDKVGIQFKDPQNDNDLKELDIAKIIKCVKRDQLYIETSDEFKGQQSDTTRPVYKLHITYSRQIDEKALDGLYISKYIDQEILDSDHEDQTDQGLEKSIAVTQFQPISARKAFPCFDEPNFKATFAIKVVHQDDHQVFSNSRLKGKINLKDAPVTTEPGIELTPTEAPMQHKSSELVISEFYKTVKMSTYLVAVTINDFATKTRESPRGHVVNAIAPKDAIDNSDYALDITTLMMDVYDNFFGIDYPLDKLDIIAINDFAHSAMENWGLMTFVANNILYNEEEDSIFDKEDVVEVINHEVSHQWFGNLVTMHWWSDLWLNEGFAAFMQLKGTEIMYPEWEMSDQFIIKTTHPVMRSDAMRSTHAVSNEITDPDVIMESFDDITYLKTACLIRYLTKIIGMDNFKAGLKEYFENFKYSNAKSVDLWNVFGDHGFVDGDNGGKFSINEVMDSWIKQKGFPVLKVSLNDGIMKIEQKVFNALVTPKNDSEVEPKWIIRTSYITSNNPKDIQSKWLTTGMTQFQFKDSADWIYFNVDAAGYYRVQYERENWIAIIQMLKKTDPKEHVLGPSDRAALLDDAFAFMMSGQLSIDLAMKLMTYLEDNERHFVPWAAALSNFQNLCSRLGPEGEPFKQFVKKMISPIIEELGLEDDGDDMEKRLRIKIIDTAIKVGDEYVGEYFAKKFQDWKNGEKIGGNSKSAAITSVMKYGSDEDKNYVWEKYQDKTLSKSDKKKFVEGLASGADKDLVEEILDNIINNKDFKMDGIDLLKYMKHNSVVRSNQVNLWQWYQDHFEEICTKLGDSPALEILSQVIGGINTRQEADEVVEFIKSKKDAIKDRHIDSFSEKIEDILFWKTELEDKFLNWLELYFDQNE